MKRLLMILVAAVILLLATTPPATARGRMNRRAVEPQSFYMQYLPDWIIQILFYRPNPCFTDPAHPCYRAPW